MYQIRTRSHEEFMSAQAALTVKAKAGSLTPAEVSDAIDQYYDDGDYIDQSIGTAWIIKNPQLFEQVVPAYMRCTFLMSNLGAAHCSELLICYEAVLRTLTLPECRSYVHHAFRTNGARNNSWIRAALAVGITPEELHTTISTRLTEAPGEDQQRRTVMAFHDFLSYGSHGSHGSAECSHYTPDIDNPDNWGVPKDSVWGVCTRDQFYTLALVCAKKAPAQVFANWGKLRAMLVKEQVNEVLKIAATGLENFPNQVEALLKLPQTVREELLRKLKPTDANSGENFTKLMVPTVLTAGDPAKLYGEIAENVAAVHPLVMYVTAKSVLAKIDPSPTVHWLLVLIQTRLWEAGYVAGKLIMGTYYDKKRNETRNQLYVYHNGARYLQDRDYGNRFYPNAGDTVIINPQQVVRRLTPKVFTVRYNPS